MGVANDLEKLEELRRKGALSNEEFERAKAKIFNTPTNAPQVLNEERQPSRIKNLVVAVCIVAILGAILGGAAWFLFGRVVGVENAEKLLSKVTKTPITLIDEIENIRASHRSGLPITLPYTGTLDISVEIVNGNPLDIYVIEYSELEKFANSEKFQHYPDFQATKTKIYKRSASISEGVYYIMIRDTSLGFLSSSSTDYKITAKLKP